MNIDQKTLNRIIKEEIEKFQGNNNNRCLESVVKERSKKSNLNFSEKDFSKIKQLLEQQVVSLEKLIPGEVVTDMVGPVDEPAVMGDGGTAKTARSQLFHIAKEAQSLHDRLDDSDELPEWVQGKIAVVSDNLDAVVQHLEYKLHKHNSED
jgi:hypothetical protein